MRYLTVILLFVSMSALGQTQQKRTWWPDGSFSWNVAVSDKSGNQARSFDGHVVDDL